jgi:hypothetical protein
MVEFVLPPIRFRHLGWINLYSNWLQFTAFSSLLYTRENDFGNNRFINIGTQADLKIIIFSLLESTLSIGYASAFDLASPCKRYNEWMVSLKLLK